jgi:hypothetical protein
VEFEAGGEIIVEGGDLTALLVDVWIAVEVLSEWGVADVFSALSVPGSDDTACGEPTSAQDSTSQSL